MQPFINKPGARLLSLPVLSDILGVGGNLSCLYNKATAQCLWHHIHGNPNIACTGKEDFIRWLGGGSFWGGAVGEGCLWDAGLCWEGPGCPPGLGHPLRQCLPGANDAHFWLALAFHLLLHHPRWCLVLAAAHPPALPAAKSHRCWIEGKGEAEETPVAQAPKSGAGAAGLSLRAAEVQFCNPGLGRPLWWCAREKIWP